MMATIDTLMVDSTLVSEVSLEPLLPIGADALETIRLVLAVVFTIMSHLAICLAYSWVAEAVVNILGRGAPYGAGSRRLG